MKKDIASILPRDVVSEPVIITIGGYDESREPLAPSAAEDDHRISIDEVERWYTEEGELTIDIPEKFIHLPTDAFGRTIDSSEMVKKRKKKEKRQEVSLKELLLYDQDKFKGEERACDEDEKVPAPSCPVFPPVIQERQGPLTEHELYCILTSKYHFGKFGSDLYVRGMDGAYSLVNVHTVERLLMSTLTGDQRNRFKIYTANAVLRRLLATDEIDQNYLEFPKTKVLMENGCFDLETKKPAKIEDTDFFVCRIKAQYLPGEKLCCPYFDRYLETSSGGDTSIQRRICAMLGYLMLSGYPGKVILVLGTAKNSGKSMITRFYQRLVGSELVCAQTPFDMSEKHALSEFRGKVANTQMDLPAMIIKPGPVGTIKNVSGGDMISINPKGLDRRSVCCYTKQVLGTNAPIQLQQYDEAFWTRVVVIPYICSIDPDEQIVDLEDRLWAERDAIVTKCLKEARKLLKNGYRFPECQVADEMKDAWIGWQAYAKEFLQTYCVAEEGAYTQSTPLHHAYLEYCKAHNYPYGTQKGFICFAKKLFPSKGNPHRMIDGIQLRGLPDVHFLGEY